MYSFLPWLHPRLFLLQNFKKRFICSFERDKGSIYFLISNYLFLFFCVFLAKKYLFFNCFLFLFAFCYFRNCKISVFCIRFRFRCSFVRYFFLDRLPCVCSFRAFGSFSVACFRGVACIRFRECVHICTHRTHPQRTDTAPSAARGRFRENEV